MPKYVMGVLKLDGKELTCSRGTLWPPSAVLFHGDNAQECRPLVTELEYQRILVWERVCGQRTMSKDKCPSCPYVEVDGVLAKPPGGTGPKPQATTATSMAQARKKGGR